MSTRDMNMQDDLDQPTPETDELASETEGAIERIRRYFALLTSQLEGRATGVEEDRPEDVTGPG